MNIIKRATPSYIVALDRNHELDATHPYKLTCPTHSKVPLRFDNKMDADNAFNRLKEECKHQVIYTFVSRSESPSVSHIIGYAGGLKE